MANRKSNIFSLIKVYLRGEYARGEGIYKLPRGVEK
jgi:hypothetical protein